jgi:hypothetical protein
MEAPPDGGLLGVLAQLARVFWRDAEKVALLTPPTPARCDAPFLMRRSRLDSILNVAHSESKLPWQLGVGG